MKNTEALQTIIQISQRFITVNDLKKCYEMIKETGISDEQIRSFCGDYFVANTCGFEDEDEELILENFDCSVKCRESYLSKTENYFPITNLPNVNESIKKACPVYICVECKRYYIKALGKFYEEVEFNQETQDWELIRR